MYAILTGLILTEGLDFALYHMNEESYMPGSFRRGSIEAGRRIISGYV
jgi:hypothetical protein